jgi:MFS family permease
MNESRRWWQGLTPEQWLVLGMAWTGWVFDIMDVFLLVLVKDPAMRELTGKTDVEFYSGLSLAVTLVGWSLGGLIFGMVADRWGRTRTMALTILMYSVFTGLAGFAGTWWHLVLLRLLAALGIGGEWGTGASMIAEVFPPRARAVGAGLLQSASGAGFFLATFLWWAVGGDWRYAFFAGALPAFLALIVRLSLREPEAWTAARARAKASAKERLGSLAALFRDPELRRRALVATGLAIVGITAYWGTTFWSPESLTRLLSDAGVTGDALKTKRFHGMLVVNAGALVGFLIYIPITERIGRRWAFFWFHLGSFLLVPAAFLLSRTYAQWLVLFFLATVFNSGIYSGYTIQFPELFPTRLRATGASFCYNVGRIVAAPGPLLKAWFLSIFASGAAAGAVMGSLYVLGLVFIPFLPETKGVVLDTPAAQKERA